MRSQARLDAEPLLRPAPHDLDVPDERFAEDEVLPAVDVRAADLEPLLGDEPTHERFVVRVRHQEVLGEDRRVDHEGLVARLVGPIQVAADQAIPSGEAVAVVTEPEQVEVRGGDDADAGDVAHGSLSEFWG